MFLQPIVVNPQVGLLHIHLLGVTELDEAKDIDLQRLRCKGPR